MRAWWVRGLVLAGLLVVIAVAVVFTLQRPGGPGLPGEPPDNRQRAIVALGDSTMSGEGARPYVPGTDGRNGNWCHRSRRASVHSADFAGVDRTFNLACSGAPSGQVGLGDTMQYTEPSQAERLGQLAKDYRVVAVVVAVGANDDPHFSSLVDKCVRAWADRGGDGCAKNARAGWQDRLDAMRPKVVDALEDIRKVMLSADYDASEYQLVLQSYAAPLSPNIPGSLRGLAGCPFRVADLRWVRNSAVPKLNEALRDAAQQADARFLDLSRAGRGHEACTGGANNAKEWFTRLTVQWQDLNDGKRVRHALQESFHPNARGYAEFGRCLSEFLTTSDDEAACLPGRDGKLHAAASVDEQG